MHEIEGHVTAVDCFALCAAALSTIHGSFSFKGTLKLRTNLWNTYQRTERTAIGASGDQGGKQRFRFIEGADTSNAKVTDS